jgi:membrane protease YdiL (CAAX protease family)
MKKDSILGVRYLLITLLWTWGILFIPAAIGLHYSNTATQVAYILAGASPSVIALLFVLLTRDDLRMFLLRVIRPDYISAKGYAAIFLVMPAVVALSLLAQWALGAGAPDWSVLEQYLRAPLRLLQFAVFSIVFGPLAEELGWRGYLLDRFAQRRLLINGAVLGAFWALWHLPMFFINGTYQNQLLREGMVSIACFAVSTIAVSVLLSRLVLSNNRSILAAILFHFMVNFTGELIPLSIWGRCIKAALLFAIALWCLLTYKKIQGVSAPQPAQNAR